MPSAFARAPSGAEPREGRPAGRRPSVSVLLRAYAKCIDDQDTTVNRRIDEALDE
ncbi:hypothetical protein [Actinomadura sp. HBU206391]|uniref:hypothetical protein n=1 Tax=Actinomadura sp. HBU206391 TaxID=2731692 RepID=UPI00164FCB51|nr:hypothetical protein [Actinomadura sp. HBU206391]MBC6461461.1 hypothetical protein [Actinomadura sp. HBU206391]